MSKKSFKQMQNRLYREIKRRMIAEQMPVQVYKVHPRIDMLKLAKAYPCSLEPELYGYVKDDMARAFGEKLAAEGYIQFYTTTDAYHIELVGQLKVVGIEDQTLRIGTGMK